MNEKNKNYLSWAIIIAILIIAGAIWSLASTYSESFQPGLYRSFAVSAEGRAIGVPDVAQFSFSVINEGGTDIATLATENTKSVNAATEYLISMKAAKADVKTTGYNLDPRYQNTVCTSGVAGGARVCPPPSIVGYTVRSTVSVKVRKDNFESLGKILSGVVERGVNNVSQLNFTVDDTVELENEARSEAIKRAQDKAEAIAEAGDFRLGKLLSVDEVGNVPYAYGRGADTATVFSEKAAPLPAPTIEPGSQEVMVQLSLRYEIR